MTHVVYWVRLQSHTDIKSQGYVGVSKNYVVRLQKHWFDSNCSKLHVHKAMKKYKEQVVSSIISQGDIEYCYALENLLRPEANIAWNSAAGGELAVSQKGSIKSTETRERIRVKAIGRKRPQHAIDAQAAAMTGRNLWENSAANKVVWAKAKIFRDWVVANPNSSARKMAEVFGIDNCNPWKLVDKLRSGWNPSQDTAYLNWLADYEAKKEGIHA